MFLLKVSRPGLWFQTLWLYMIPLSGTMAFDTLAFWLGALYMTWPINLLVYGWNDYVDRETDRLNPRKDSFVWGAKASDEQLATLPWVIVFSQIPFAALFMGLCGWPGLLAMLGVIGSNYLYNQPRWGWRGVPPLELVNVCAMLLIIPLSSMLNSQPNVPTLTYLYLAVFCIKAQLMGEIMDIIPDRKAGRKTTANQLGSQPTKLWVMLAVILEITILWFGFSEMVLCSFLLLTLLWLIYDFLKLQKDGQYNAAQFKLLALGINGSGYGSLVYVWWTGALTGF